MNALLKDAYDLHVHSAPDILPRKMDDIEMAQRIIVSGMKGYAIKSHCYTTSATGKISWETVIEQIRAIGAERIVLTTDLGQTTGIFPDEDLALFGEKLLANGFSETDVRSMVVRNPASLIA